MPATVSGIAITQLVSSDKVLAKLQDLLQSVDSAQKDHVSVLQLQDDRPHEIIIIEKYESPPFSHYDSKLTPRNRSQQDSRLRENDMISDTIFRYQITRPQLIVDLY